MVKLSANDINDLVNEYPEVDKELHEQQKKVILMLATWGNEMGHDVVARLAGLINLANMSQKDRKKVAQFKKNKFESVGISVPEVVKTLSE